MKLFSFLLIFFSFCSFAESTIFLFNGNSPYSDPSKDFFDDLYKGVNFLGAIDNKVVFFPKQYADSLDFLVEREAMNIAFEQTTDSLANASIFDAADDNSFGIGQNFDFGFDFSSSIDLPEMTQDEKNEAEARMRLRYLYDMHHDDFASKDTLSNWLDKYIVDENKRGGEFKGDVTLYFTDHGSLKQDPQTGADIHSFGAGEGDLFISDMVNYHKMIHESFPEKKVVFIHDHCFSGGMLDSLWKNRDTLEIYPNVCGFAAASPKQPSYMGETYMDMLSQISQIDDPELIKKIDKNGDKKYSYGEAMDYYQSILHSDKSVGRAIPFSTKDVFLGAVYEQLEDKYPMTMEHQSKSSCTSEELFGSIDSSSINDPIYKILLESHIQKSEVALDQYLSFLNIDKEGEVLDTLDQQLAVDKRDLEQSEEEAAKLQDESLMLKNQVITYITSLYELPDPIGFIVNLNDELNPKIITDSEYYFEKVEEALRNSYAVSRGKEIDATEFKKLFDPYAKAFKAHEDKEAYVQNFSTRTTKYQRVLKEYKNVEALKGLMGAMKSKNPTEAKWARERFFDYLSILECENSTFTEANIES